MLSDIFGLNQVLVGRVLLATLTSFLIVLLLGKKFILYLKKHQSDGQPIRQDGPQTHLAKRGTPTMGGILIIIAIIASTLLWAELSNSFIFISLGVLIIFGITGYIDDSMKVKKKSANAMTAKMKLIIQFSTALIAVYFIALATPEDTRHLLYLPYLDLSFDLSYFYIPFAMVVIAGASNAVNLSDGLDGLAGGLSMFAFTSFALIAIITGSSDAINLNQIFIPGCKEVAIVCGAVTGACLGFLWFNSAPAQVFMGDTGSLALGALLGVVAIMTKREIVLAVIGAVFVIEALSVMIQIFWYKRTKTRVFLMAPIHHHFEQLGWKETAVVARFWIISIACAIVGLSSLLF